MHSRWDTISRKHFHFSLPDTALAIPLVCATLSVCGESGVTFGVLASTLLVAAPHPGFWPNRSHWPNGKPPQQPYCQPGQIFSFPSQRESSISSYSSILGFAAFDRVAYERPVYRSYIRDPRKHCNTRSMKNSFWIRYTWLGTSC